MAVVAAVAVVHVVVNYNVMVGHVLMDIEFWEGEVRDKQAKRERTE